MSRVLLIEAELKRVFSDISGLPVAEVASEAACVDVVQRAMADLLMRPALGPDENFFQAGGHSLLAARLSARLAESGLPRPGLRPIFEQPTARLLAGWLAQQQRAATLESARRVPVREDPSTAPLSLMQQRMWFLEQLNPGTGVNNLHSAHWLKGPMNREAFERAFLAMVHRQPVLRTRIEREEETLRQRVLPRFDGAPLHFEDMGQLAPHEREAEVQRRCAEWAAQPFDMLNAPLFRAALYRFDENLHVLLFAAHHIIWDAWSFDVLCAELAVYYSAFVQGIEPALPPLSVSYGDFSAWQLEWLKGEELQRQASQWVKKLSPLPDPLDLPSSRKRPKRMTGGGRSFHLLLTGAVLERLTLFATQQGTTLYVCLLAMYALALRQFSNQSDLCIGTPVRGRESSDLEPLMGFFVNMLPMRLTLAGEISAGEWVRQVHHEVQAAFDAPDVPFEHLMRELNPPRDLSRPPLHQASFSFQDVRTRPMQWGGLEVSRLLVPVRGATQDLSLWCVLTKELLEFVYSFNTDVFDEADCRLLAERLLTMVERLPDAHHLPARELLAPHPSERDRQQAWNATDAAYDRSATVHGVIAAQAARTPAAPAVLQPCFGELSHGELHERSNRLARALRVRGVARGALVGLCIERGLDMLVAQLAILKAGAAYVPLDPAYPGDRLTDMAKDAQLALLVSESSLVHALPWPREKTLLLDIDAASIDSQPDAALPPDAARDAQPLDPAYVIYTSGSTGMPKGVAVHHQAVVNFLAAMAREPGLKASDTLLAVTTLSFDIAVLELLLPLTVGAKIVLASREDALDGGALAAMLTEHRVTVMQATPSSWRMLVESGWKPTPGLKALIGGEGLPVDLAEQLLERCGELWNMYGPTETTVWSTCWRVEHPQRGIRIGRPIANTTIHILDERLQPCPIGVPGEICIGGEGVALGYHQRPELTAERFIADPERPGERLYRTGDRGRWCHDGTLEHHGRTDFQVKVRGHRIELGEIESQLMDHPSVARVVVIAREDRPGDQRLVAYLVAKPAAATEAAALREHLKTRLPHYMLPQHFVELDAIPLLPNGKVNRKALPVPNAEQDATDNCADGTVPANATEQAIAAIWVRLLNVEKVGSNDYFFNLGGHSLLALRAVQEMQRITGEKIDVGRLIFESLGQIAASIAIEPSHAAPIDSLAAEVRVEADAANGLPRSLAMRPVRFGHPASSLYGVFHPGGLRNVRQRAVLFCNPFGQEAVRIHRFFCVLADSLARAGVACLRFDYHASGESMGDDREADLDRWVQDVLAADALLRQRAGVQEVDWVAPRLASALAVRASVQAPQIPQQLVLWEPVISGARYVDHLQAVHASMIADLPDGGALAGDEEILGYGVSRRLLEQIRTVAPADYQRARTRRVLLVASHQQATDADKLVVALRGSGVAARRQTLTLDFDWTSEEAFNTALVPINALNLLAAVLRGDQLE
ncbi:non-ribosomal peptide synthetase [Hydrogenophaga sp. 2FB]|uniref:non-ribosomal peptide synthetase n=1 Tax=Hydrogenophaga sp. 2FB TaxID=2502187 RepID=UPI0010FA5296|nr:non-ribosomal peptide synthetase [Hydrogenophaga sp. 2FB]